MPLTIRKYWGKLQGRTTLNFNWDAIDQIRTWIGREADGDLRNPAIPLADLAAPAGVKPTASR